MLFFLQAACITKEANTKISQPYIQKILRQDTLIPDIDKAINKLV